MDRGPNGGQVRRAGVRTGHVPEIQQYDLAAPLRRPGRLSPLVGEQEGAADVPAAAHEIVHDACRIDSLWRVVRCGRARHPEARGSPDKPGGHATLEPSHRRHTNSRQTPKTYSVPLVEGTN